MRLIFIGKNLPHLTYGKEYFINTIVNSYVYNDYGVFVIVNKDMFISKEEFRDIKIKSILDDINL